MFSTGFTPTIVSGGTTSQSTSADTLSFDGTDAGATSYTATDDLTTTINANALSFSNIAGVMATLARGGAGTNNSITLGGTTPTVTSGAGAVVSNLDLILTANTGFNIGAGGFTQNYVVSDGGGGFSLTKTGAGTLTLGATNTYTGGTTVNNGTLALARGGGAGAVRGVVTVNSGATLNLTANNALGYSAGSQVTTVNINGGTVNTIGTPGDEGYLTSFNLTGGTLAYAAGSYQFAAADGTAPGITSNASSTQSLISGGVNIRSGNLGFNVASGPTASGIDLLVSGAVTGGFGLTKNGSGVLALSAMNTFSGGLTINAGTVSSTSSGGGSALGTGNVMVNTGATLQGSAGDAFGYGATTSPSLITIAGGTVTSGKNGNYRVTLPDITFSGGGTGNANINVINPGATTALINAGTIGFQAPNVNFNVDRGTAASDLTVSSVLFNYVNGTPATLTKTGVGILTLSGANTFNGNVLINGGTLTVGRAAANNGTSGALGNASVAGRTITVNSGATLNGTVNNWFGNNGNADANLPTIIVNGGTLSTSRYTTIGSLTLNGATVTNSETQDSGNYQVFALRGGVTVGGTAASTISAAAATATTQGYHLGANTLFTVGSTGATGADLTVSAPLRNQSGDFGNAAGGLTKSGAGTMVLFGTNTYTGGTTVSQGTLSGNAGSYGSGAVTVASGATVDYTQGGGAAGTATNNISGAGTATFGGNPGGAVTPGGTVNYTGQDSTTQTNVQSGTVMLNRTGGSALTGPVAVATGATVGLGSNNQIATTTPGTANPASVALNGGTLGANGHSDGTISGTVSSDPTTSAVTSSLGTLSLASGASTFDFGIGSTNTIFAFADSIGSLGTGTGTLNILNYTGMANALYIGTTNDLTSSELSRISFNGLAATQLTNGQFAAAPEPSQYVSFAVGLLGLGALVLRARKRKAAAAQAA